MLNIKVIQTLDFAAEEAWPILEDYGNISRWIQGIDKLEIIGEGVGMIRRIHMDALDEPIDEVLDFMDSDNMHFGYSIPKGLPLPLTDYKAEAQIKALEGGRCEVTWQSHCNPEAGLSEADATAILEGTYKQLIGWLEEYLTSQPA